jgi:hypothetical protein
VPGSLNQIAFFDHGIILHSPRFYCQQARREKGRVSAPTETRPGKMKSGNVNGFVSSEDPHPCAHAVLAGAFQNQPHTLACNNKSPEFRHRVFVSESHIASSSQRLQR